MAWDCSAGRLVYLPPFYGPLVRLIERRGMRVLLKSCRRRPGLRRYLEVLT
jgi:hypothetical protein